MEKKLYILLTRFPDRGSKWIETFTGCRYAHAAIGLDEDLNKFYSFKAKGFMTEEITRYLRPDREPFACQLYELPVTERKYSRVKKLISLFKARKSELHYTRLGVVLSLLRIPYKRRSHYFCSYFVADVLQQCEAVKLKKSSSLYLPGDLRKLSGARLVYQGNMSDMAVRFRLLPIRMYQKKIV